MIKRFCLPVFLVVSLASSGQNISRVESKESLYLELMKNGKVVGKATGFVIKSPTRNYLVTNYHVVTNKVPGSKGWISTRRTVAPDKVAIFHHTGTANEYVVKYEKLYDRQGRKKWYENRIKDSVIDVVALPLTDTADITIYPVYFNNTHDYSYREAISVGGFPEGISEGASTTDTAKISTSEPLAFVDEKTFDAMSGSPVFYFPRYLEEMIAEDTTDATDYAPLFVGVFSRSAQMPTNILKSSFLLKNFMKLP